MVETTLLFQKMLELLLMMCVGYVAGKTKVMTKESNRALSMIINNIAMPFLALQASVTSEHMLSGREVLGLLGILFASIFLMVVVARLVRLALHPAQENGGVYELLMVFPNSSFIGIPVASAIYGSIAVFCISMNNLPFYFLLYCYGVSLIQGEPMQKIHFRQMVTPLTVAAVLGVVLYLCNVTLPPILTEPMQAIGQISTPGAMMVVGATLSGVRLKGVVRNWRLFLMTAGKLILAPIVTNLLFGLFVRDEMILGIITLIAAMPSGSIASLLAAQYGKNEELAAEGVFLTTVLSVVTIPLMAALLL